MSHLAPVIGTGDLPLAELHAARLDGELNAVDECFSPIDTPLTVEARALALHNLLAHYRGLEKRLVAEQRTAAWVWGALAAPPHPHQFCAPVSVHKRDNSAQLGRVREVRLGQDDLVIVGGLRVTTPLRTVLDFVRSTAGFDGDEIRIVSRLLDVAGLRVSDCVDALDDRRNIPLKNLALGRLECVPERLY